MTEERREKRRKRVTVVPNRFERVGIAISVLLLLYFFFCALAG